MQGQKISFLVTKQLMKEKNLNLYLPKYGFKQVISDPIHILKFSSSCMNLIFTSQLNLVMNSGVHYSLHPNSYHQIIHAKFNLKIFYPPPYKRVV